MTTQETARIYSDILDKVKAIDPINTRKWFDELNPISFDGGTLQIGCPENSMTQYLTDTCLPAFTQAAQNITGHLVSVCFQTVSQEPRAPQPARPLPETEQIFKLHPDYTFETFVVGPSNRLAHASCVAVSNSPGNTYNPLFLYGSVGLGKTHLLHATCHGIDKNIQNARIQFLSCEEFVNQFISAIEQGTLSQFQNRFRTVDILVIDDVQFLREREQSQEEFFHTFNALYNNNKQIVLTADCAPSELPSLEERLVSRFKWGLVARLDAPSYETRIAIVQKKAHMRGLTISEEVAEYIASKVTANIRELEGALTIIYATAKTNGDEITLELARHALGAQDFTAEKPTSISDIIAAVTSYYDVRLSDLQSKKRSQSIALPRQICMYLARSLTSLSLEEIGGHLGGRDHTTVMHACSKVNELTHKDPDLKSRVQEITTSIKQN